MRRREKTVDSLPDSGIDQAINQRLPTSKTFYYTPEPSAVQVVPRLKFLCKELTGLLGNRSDVPKSFAFLPYLLHKFLEYNITFIKCYPYYIPETKTV
ncbi:hypothetical protein ACSAZL_00925 [Methanosarcina sp. T3]|uniref:hypothetical protein n=1 Tax=Methanosarcina sp. T3 TaxID=3439062 RepID=UPI003F862161